MHAEGTQRLARALAEVVDRRGKKDLREWGGPAAGTVNEILAGTWKRSPQTRKTFDKLDAAGAWPTGLARMIYANHPSAISALDENGQVRSEVLVGGSHVQEPTTLSSEEALSGGAAVTPTRQAEPRSNQKGELTLGERELIGQAVGLLAEAVEILRAVAEPPPDRQ